MIIALRKFIIASLAITLIACTAQKVTFNPVIVNGTQSSIYRGSYTKLTDIVHTKLDIKLNWDSSLVIGKAWITAKPYFYSSNEVILDANGFKIVEVALSSKNDQKSLTYKYDGKKLIISLDKTYTKDQKFTLFIDYVAMPAKLQIGTDIPSAKNRGFYFINPTGAEINKPVQFWTQGETEANSTWFPTINGPQEKMTQEIVLTVPKKMQTLSNGFLDFSSDNGDGTRTDFWRQDQPHSTYLTMIAGGNFSIVKDKWEDKEVNYYVEPEYAKYAKLIFGKTPEMIGFFSKKLGIEYPWEKYSQIVVREFNDGAMENTTATVFFDGMQMTDAQYLDENYEEIISHELFHHWFGNLVTAESWSQLPLNESFATYGEYLWNEYKYGRDYADLYAWRDQKIYLAGNSSGLNVIRFHYSQRDDLFDDVSYQKGGRILHMLRKTVGDDAFFKALNMYLKNYSFKTAEIHDLRLVFEEVTGQDLNWFFNQWFLASGHPELAIETTYDVTGKVNITIKQQQDLEKTPLYRIPMMVDIYIAGTVERKEIVLDKQSQTFSFPVLKEPDLVNVDAEKYLLAKKIEQKTAQQYAFQYTNAPLFLDRLEAFQALQKMPAEKLSHQIFIKALADKNWQIRLYAVNSVNQLTEDEKSAAYPILKSMALADDRSYVRAAAITSLLTVFLSKDNKDIILKATLDKAPSVQKALSLSK